jgi:hypothetical protein
VSLNKIQNHNDETEQWAYMYGIPELFSKKNINKYSYPLIPNITISNSVINNATNASNIYHNDVINNTISCNAILRYYVEEDKAEAEIIARISGEFRSNNDTLALIVVKEYYELARLLLTNGNCNYIVRWVVNSDLLEFIIDKFRHCLRVEIENLINHYLYLSSIGL